MFFLSNLLCEFLLELIESLFYCHINRVLKALKLWEYQPLQKFQLLFLLVYLLTL
jgi:hypothetical protein